MGKLQGQSSSFLPGSPAKKNEAHEPIVQFLLKEVRGSSVIDLGGGERTYALKLKDAGYDVIVADINPESLSTAEHYGLKTKLLGPNEQLDENTADTIILIEVLEHISTPADFLMSAVKAAKKRVLFSLPCTEDFKPLFDAGLTYAHIAVTDHLWHFSNKELRELLDSLSVEYTLTMGDYLFPTPAIRLLRHYYRGPIGYLFTLVLRIINKLNIIPRRCPSRFYGIIEKR